jgi:hypothetical protein
MPSDSRPMPLRLLFATPGVLDLDRARGLAALCASLQVLGVNPVQLEGWDGAGRLRVDRTDAVGYPCYRSQTPEADITTLALMERPNIAVLIGTESLCLVPPLVATGLPALLWTVGDWPFDLGAVEESRTLALAATTAPEAARLSVIQGRAVWPLPLPRAEKPDVQGGGDAILVLGDQRGDGVVLALGLAEAYPAHRFLLPARDSRPPWLHGQLSRLPNVRGLAMGEAVPPLRLALLAHTVSVPPWGMLAELMRAGVPILGGDTPLLAAGIGDAGLCLSLTAPASRWCAAFEGLTGTGNVRLSAEAACVGQADYLRPSAAAAAMLWRETLLAHIARCHGFTAGRI